nr:isoleucine--tRNA ligase [Bacteriovoracaceae bacterium]
EWEKTITRLGRWVDFKNDYKTMDTPFMESVWWVFKNLWDQGLIYQGSKVVPISTAFGSVLSNFEAGSNYQDVQDPALTVLFSLKKEWLGKPTFIAAWTTTPWTLPANVGLCVGAKIDYVLVLDKKTQKQIILAKDRLSAFEKKGDFEILETFLGDKLKGLSYHPLFSFFESLEAEGAFHIFNDDYVTTSDGTGVVHLAPAFGEDDHRVMRLNGLKTIPCPVDVFGKFTVDAPPYQNLYIKDADKEIIKYLKDGGVLFDHSTIVHSYPFCPRTDTPLIYRMIPSWFVKVEQMSEELLASNEQINWVPEHIKEGRFGHWLKGARDWAISRNRIWGTPLPIWENNITGKKICVGSVAELQKLSGIKLTDLHREYVDPLVFKIENEEGEYHRIPDILDCWFESGSMPYAQIHYPFENENVFKEGFPAEFIAEGLDQTRGWFYTLTVISTALFKKPAFKNVIVNGLVLAKDGKKMSKRLQNYTAPDALMELHGADALRLFLINSGLVRGEELRFTDDGVKEVVRRVLLPWYNAFNFFKTYAEVDGWNAKEHSISSSENILDQWLLSKLQSLTLKVTQEMESYRLYNVVPALINFIDDLTNWYIRLNRRRFWEGGLTPDKKKAYSTLFKTLTDTAKLMAPFTPFLSEHIFLSLKKFSCEEEESIHLCSYPVAQEELIVPSLEDAVDRMQQIILLGRQLRADRKENIRKPLASMTLIHKNSQVLKEILKLSEYIQAELNVVKILTSHQESDYIKLYAKPNLPILGKKFGKRINEIKKEIEVLSAEMLERIENGETLCVGAETLTLEDLLILRESKSADVKSNRFISLQMDFTSHPDLIMSWYAREFVRLIQEKRKKMNFAVSDHIHIFYKGAQKDLLELFVQALIKKEDYIRHETLADSLINSQAKEYSHAEDFTTLELDQETISLLIHLEKA